MSSKISLAPDPLRPTIVNIGACSHKNCLNRTFWVDFIHVDEVVVMAGIADRLGAAGVAGFVTELLL